MKKFLIAGLVTATAAVGLISQASAASRYCFENPDDQRCYQDYGNGYQPPGPTPPVYDGGNGYPPPAPPRRHYRQPNYPVFNDNPYGYGSDQGAVFSFQFGNSGNSCSDIGDSLRQTGFRHVQAYDCAGRDYGFTALRDGQRLRIRVKSATGRIFAISPY